MTTIGNYMTGNYATPPASNPPSTLTQNPTGKVSEQSKWSQLLANEQPPAPHVPQNPTVVENSIETLKLDRATMYERMIEKQRRFLEQERRFLEQQQPTIKRVSLYEEIVDPIKAMIEHERKRIEELVFEPDDKLGAESQQAILRALDDMDAAVAECKKNSEADPGTMNKQAAILGIKIMAITIALDLNLRVLAYKKAPPSNEAQPSKEAQPEIKPRTEFGAQEEGKQNPSLISKILRALTPSDLHSRSSELSPSS